MAPVLLSSAREKSLDAWKRERNDKKLSIHKSEGDKEPECTCDKIV